MAVPTTATWSLDNDDIADAAFARLGGERVSGWEAKSAVRNLHLLLQYFESRRVNLWSIQQRSFVTTSGAYAYQLPADTVDVLRDTLNEMVGTTETPLARGSRDDWFVQPDKTSTGRPTIWFLDRQRDAPILRFWPAPDATPRTIVYAAVTRLRDAGGLADSIDTPRRWLPAVISGLAYYLGRERAMKPDEMGVLVRGELSRLKAEFESDFMVAQEEDRDSAAVSFDVDLSAYFR